MVVIILSFKINNPKQRLSRNVIKVWLISNTISNLIWMLILVGLIYAHSYFEWHPLVRSVLILVAMLVIIRTIWSFVKPFLLYKNWRYDVSEEFLQLKFGALNEERRLVPMTKIQSVATRQGPILRYFGLYSLTIDTTGTTHTIPAISEEAGLNLRDEIAHYAKIREVESQ